MTEPGWFDGGFKGMYGIIVSLLFLASLYCQYQHWGVSGPRRWFHVTHLVWCLLFMTDAYLDASTSTQSYIGSNTVPHRLITNLLYASDLMLLTVAILYLSKVTQHLPHSIPYSVARYCFFIINGTWELYTAVIVLLFAFCDGTPPNSVIACAQSKGDPQSTVLIRAIMWMALSVAMTAFGVSYLRATTSQLTSRTSWWLFVGGGVLTILFMAQRGILWLVLCLHSFDDSFPEVHLNTAQYTTWVIALPVIVPGTIYVLWLWAPIQFQLCKPHTLDLVQSLILWSVSARGSSFVCCAAGSGDQFSNIFEQKLTCNIDSCNSTSTQGSPVSVQLNPISRSASCQSRIGSAAGEDHVLELNPISRSMSCQSRIAATAGGDHVLALNPINTSRSSQSDLSAAAEEDHVLDLEPVVDQDHVRQTTRYTRTTRINSNRYTSPAGSGAEDYGVSPVGSGAEEGGLNVANIKCMSRLLTAEHAAGVVEELRPSALALHVANDWREVALMGGERLLDQFRKQKKRAGCSLLFADAVDKTSGVAEMFGHGESHRARERLVIALDEAEQVFEKHMHLLGLEMDEFYISGLPSCGDDEERMRPSSAKKTRLASCVPTNLMVYSVRDSTQALYSTITVGAPAAHCLRYKDGGAVRLQRKIAALQKKLTAQMQWRSLELDETDLADGTQIEILKLQLYQRHTICVPQGVAAALAAVFENVSQHSSDSHYALIKERGLLLQISSLLSTQGDETGMLEDFIYTVKVLNGCRVRFEQCEPEGEQDTKVLAESVRWVDHQSLVIKVPSNAWATRLVSYFTSEDWLAICPVFFTVGVNEMQSIAGVIGDTSLESETNAFGIKQLKTYLFFALLCCINWWCGSYCEGNTLADIKAIAEIERLVSKGDGKQSQILTLAAQATRAVQGAHWMSCKSAKDRTSMLCTLEAAQTLLPLPSNDSDNAKQLEFANMLRSQEGVRLRNCKINTGKNHYAFNNLQRTQLPKELQPPKGTFGGGCQS